MIAFLRQSKHNAQRNKPITLVYGSEACDLDSAITSTCLAYFYQMLQEQKDTDQLIQYCCKGRYYIPVLNILREDYIIKTEVEYVFNKYAITAELLTFKNDVTDEMLQRAHIILVDHQLSPLLAYCFELVDHKPLDPNIEFPSACKLRIDEVASCATIVAEQVLEACSVNSDLRKVCGFSMLSMLRTAIIFDTLNFSELHNRYTEKDLLVCEQLEAAVERCANREPEPRDLLFISLKEAKHDMEGLNVGQILRKELILFTQLPSNITVSVSCFSGRISKLIKMEDAEEHIQEFAYNRNVAVIVLIGKFYDNDMIEERELGIINVKESNLYDTICNKLLALNDPSLELEPLKDVDFIDGRFYNQQNTSLSKTLMYPLINDILKNWWEEQTEEYKQKHMEALMSKVENEEEIV